MEDEEAQEAGAVLLEEIAHLDEMARTFVACGTPDQVREWIEPLWQRASSIAVLPPSWGLSQQEAAEKQRAIEDELWPG